MQLKNPKKTVKVLYLYLTLPLLLIALILFLSTGSKSEEKSEDEPAAAKSDKKEEGRDDGPRLKWGRECAAKSDCRVGESCLDNRCVNLLRERRSQPEAKKPADDGKSGTEWATIIAAIMGGLTGLLGAVTQMVVAFFAARERRRKR